MTVVHRKGRYGVKVWDSAMRGYRWIGTYHSEVTAREAEYAAQQGLEIPLPPDRPPVWAVEGDFVYFIAAMSLGVVKIGFTSDVKTRFKDLSCSSPVELTLLRIVEGDLDLESQMHRRFALFRLRREWFKIAGSLEDFLADAPNDSRLDVVQAETALAELPVKTCDRCDAS